MPFTGGALMPPSRSASRLTRLSTPNPNTARQSCSGVGRQRLVAGERLLDRADADSALNTAQRIDVAGYRRDVVANAHETGSHRRVRSLCGS